jgi:hypothetical protein
MQDRTEFTHKLLELQETEYKNTLALLAVIELLVEKNIISAQELSQKTGMINDYAMQDADKADA